MLMGEESTVEQSKAKLKFQCLKACEAKKENEEIIAFYFGFYMCGICIRFLKWTCNSFSTFCC